MRIGILATGHTPPELIGQHGDYGEMVARTIASADPALEIATYAVIDGVFPARPDECDGWVITGSRYGAYDPDPWIGQLAQLVRDCFAARVPVAGICFGHQIMAKALGGRVEKAEIGWGVGPHRYAVSPDADWIEGGSFTINAMHQDQVLEPPPGAKVIASSDFCPIAALSYDDLGLSFQGHPEFDNAYERELIEARRGKPVPDTVALEGIARIPAKAEAEDAGRVAGWIVRFLKEAAAKRGA